MRCRVSDVIERRWPVCPRARRRTFSFQSLLVHESLQGRRWSAEEAEKVSDGTKFTDELASS
jgi:hypothetical protein